MDHASSDPDVDRYVSINAACRQFAMSRSTFYRLLADPDTGLDAILVRIPPATGRLRVPLCAFERWLRERNATPRRRRAS